MRFLFSIGLMMFLLTSCGGTKVTRIDAESTTDLSGKWNDTDSRLVSEEMLKDCLSNAWYQRYSSGSKIPKIIVGTIRNKSHEHINVETFVKDIERSLINSGKVDFVASKSERMELREEKIDQMSGNASESTVKNLGNESGADVMLYGSINTIVDQNSKESVIFYQVNLELVDIESNRKLWIGSKKIKKVISKSRTRL